MLSYELAKQLKEVGFPQDFKGGVRVCKHNLPIGDGAHGTLYPPCKVEDLVYLSTLSGLIEECGDGFFSLRYAKLHAPEAYPPSKRIQEIREGNFWIADGEQCWTTAKTPKIAVAKLYIKIREKK